jgi:hypothetical protein
MKTKMPSVLDSLMNLLQDSSEIRREIYTWDKEVLYVKEGLEKNG